MSNLKNLVGKNLRRLRKAKKLTQSQLSVIADVQYRTIGYIEQGRYLGRVETLEKLINALDVPAADLFLELEATPEDSSSLKIQKIIQALNSCESSKLDTVQKVILALCESL